MGGRHGGQGSGDFSQLVRARLSAGGGGRGRGTRIHSGVQVFQVAETLTDDILQKMHAVDTRKAFAHVPLADQRLGEADAIFFGTPTRYGAATAQMRAFLDATGQLWATGALIGKVAAAFTSTGSQHGGQETTLLAFSTFFFHQGMVITGVPTALRNSRT